MIIYIGAHEIDPDNQLSHVKIGNRFGFRILILDRWIDLYWPDGPDYPVPPPEEMNRIIDAEIEGAN